MVSTIWTEPYYALWNSAKHETAQRGTSHRMHWIFDFLLFSLLLQAMHLLNGGSGSGRWEPTSVSRKSSGRPYLAFAFNSWFLFTKDGKLDTLFFLLVKLPIKFLPSVVRNCKLFIGYCTNRACGENDCRRNGLHKGLVYIGDCFILLL